MPVFGDFIRFLAYLVACPHHFCGMSSRNECNPNQFATLIMFVSSKSIQRISVSPIKKISQKIAINEIPSQHPELYVLHLMGVLGPISLWCLGPSKCQPWSELQKPAKTSEILLAKPDALPEPPATVLHVLPSCHGKGDDLATWLRPTSNPFRKAGISK